jgi:Spy/CpxP family protein refolding chaperone
MKNAIFVSLFASVVLAGTALPSLADSAAIASPQLLSQRGPNPQREERLMESLNLNEQQKQELNAIRQKYQGKMDKLNTELRTRQDELRTLMGGNASDNDIRAKHNQVVSLRQQLGELRFDSMLESRKVLTPDQRQQFAQMMDDRRVRMVNKGQKPRK